MSLDSVKNFGKVIVSTGYDASANSIVLSGSEGSKLPDPSISNFNLVWWNSSDYADPSDDPNKEIVRCTAKSTDTLTISRAQESTSATTKNTGGKTYKMILGLTSKIITDIDAAKVNKAGDTMSGNLTFSGAQKIIGGTGTTSDLSLQTTSGVGETGADMHFLVGNNGTTEAVTILNSGNVGIGNTNPGGKLEIKDGELRLSDTDVAHGITDWAPTDVYSLLRPYDNVAGSGGLDFVAISDADAEAIRIVGIIGSTAPTNTKAAIRLKGGKKGTGIEAVALGASETLLKIDNYYTDVFTILGSGNVGIGTTIPTTKLQVNGSISTVREHFDSPSNGSHTLTIYRQDTMGILYVLANYEAAHIDSRTYILTATWTNKNITQIATVTSGSPYISSVTINSANDNVIITVTTQNSPTFLEIVYVAGIW